MEGVRDVSPAVVDAVDAQLRSELKGARVRPASLPSAEPHVVESVSTPDRPTPPADASPATAVWTDAPGTAQAGDQTGPLADLVEGPGSATPLETMLDASAKTRRRATVLILVFTGALALGVLWFLRAPSPPWAQAPGVEPDAHAPDDVARAVQEPPGTVAPPSPVAPPVAPQPRRAPAASGLTTATGAAPSPLGATDPTSATCSGASEALALCTSVASPAPSASPAARAPAAPQPVGAPEACSPERTALGLCAAR
jgi:hypothetical protein